MANGDITINEEGKRFFDWLIYLCVQIIFSYSSPIICLLLEIYHDNPIIYHTIMQWQLYRSFCTKTVCVAWKRKRRKWNKTEKKEEEKKTTPNHQVKCIWYEASSICLFVKFMHKCVYNPTHKPKMTRPSIYSFFKTLFHGIDWCVALPCTVLFSECSVSHHPSLACANVFVWVHALTNMVLEFIMYRHRKYFMKIVWFW